MGRTWFALPARPTRRRPWRRWWRRDRPGGNPGRPPPWRPGGAAAVPGAAHPPRLRRRQVRQDAPLRPRDRPPGSPLHKLVYRARLDRPHFPGRTGLWQYVVSFLSRLVEVFSLDLPHSFKASTRDRPVPQSHRI
ncbi:uncharacterized protein LOC112350756 isoform X2 [Selaginella moellendorffii]|uniref:uncharacterized protein LOC112350756 isoform X2 n=1 Tax=Selaginella moellendorffii TaxID=88036 RepID=UPI000D1CD7E8|nr:uncharacterized protein LOC112350756 isoform X2 [Selaginella moellendorffii]|eukprot:XP_024543318.1 uncharacterized protein LOC112350756 isoform X2 [Selaginella moellendorffii]